MKSSFFIPVTVIAFTVVVTAAFALRAQDAAASASRGGSKPAADLKTAGEKSASAKWVFSLLSDDLQKKLSNEYDYVVGTEMSSEGRKLPTPDFGKPQYYIMQSMERHDSGDVRGDTKDTQDIPVAALKKQLFAALASNGYRPAEVNHPPTQVLTFVCGALNKIDPISDTGGDSGSDGGGSGADTGNLQNLRSRAEIVGGKKFAGEFAAAFAGQLQCSGTSGCEPSDSLRRFVTRDDTTGVLVYAIFNDCYYCIVTAHDMGALKNNGGKLLWTTRVSAIARGVSFEQMLPILINNSAYFFGRETDGVEIVRKRAYRNTGIPISEESAAKYISSGTSASGTSATTAPKPAPSGAASATGKP